MLVHLSIKNFAIIEDLSLDFESGMTAITGETGAGKSIVIEALQSVLGARSDASMVRSHCDRADIAVSFDLKNIPAAKTWLIEASLHNEIDPNECILRRTLQSEGRSKHFINGHLATQAQIRSFSDYLISIQGQHENQRLLQRDDQLSLLDNFAQHDLLLETVKKTYQEWQAVQIEIQQLKNQEASGSEVALLQYQIEELQKLATTPTEEATLSAEYKKSAHADKLLQECALTQGLLAEDDANSFDLMTSALKRLHALQILDPSFKNIAASLETAKSYLQEAIAQLEDAHQTIEINPARLAEIEERLQKLHDTARKYKVAPQDLNALAQKLESQLEKLSEANQQIDLLEKKSVALASAYQVASAQLSASRQKAAERFNTAVTAHIQELGMPEGIFSLSFERLEKFTMLGAEKIEFLISANPGQALKPLHKIASGGELSRVSLAIHVITAQLDNTPSLIFDEVDVGISGGTAEIVGRLLRQLAEKAQVICITHLAQVAALGHQHLKIQKTVAAGQTQSHLVELHRLDRIEEIARLLGGVKITDKTREHAKEMLEHVS